MICSRCQSPVRTTDEKCGVCGNSVRRISSTVPTNIEPEAVSINTMPSDWQALTCPSCQSPIDTSTVGQYCPVCSTPIASGTAGLQSQRAGDERYQQNVSSVDRLRDGGMMVEPHLTQVHRFSNYGHGTIVGEPTQLQDEPRDADTLQVLISLLLLVELAVVMAAVSMSVLIVGIGIVVLIFALGMRGGWFAMGCMTSVLRPLMTAATVAMRTLFGGISPRLNPANIRHVREYRLDLVEGDQNTFVVKGNTAPRTLRSGDSVQIWTTQRHGRPYLQRGFLEESGLLVPVRVSEPSSGMYWLIGFVVINLVLAFIYFTYVSG